MSSLVGTVYSPGTIVFDRENNDWAFKLVKANAGVEPIPRVLFDPKKVSMELHLSPKVDPEGFGWLKRIETFLATADKVYLKPENDGMRFMQAIHDFGKRQKLITLGHQRDVDAFANKFWKNIRMLYATRHDDFRFHVGTFVTNKVGTEKDTNSIEIKTRMIPDEDEAKLPNICFDATGSEAAYQVVDWRKETEPYKPSRFAMDGHHVELKVAVQRQPFSFLHEYREEFKNHSFTFEGDNLDAKLRKIEKMQAKIASD